MPRHIGFAVGRGAVRVTVCVVARVPTARTDVDAATYRKVIVEHGDLLMMAASDRMRAVEAEANRACQFPACDHRQDARHRELFQPAEIPAQDVDVAIGLFMREAQQIIAERFALAMFVGLQCNARIEVPADQQDTLLRIRHQPFEQRKNKSAASTIIRALSARSIRQQLRPSTTIGWRSRLLIAADTHGGGDGCKGAGQAATNCSGVSAIIASLPASILRRSDPASGRKRSPK